MLETLAELVAALLLSRWWQAFGRKWLTRPGWQTGGWANGAYNLGEVIRARHGRMGPASSTPPGGGRRRWPPGGSCCPKSVPPRS